MLENSDIQLQVTRLFTQLTKCWRQHPDLETLLLETAAEISSYLKIDCVQICQLQADRPAQILVEVLREQLLPSSLALPNREEGMLTFFEDLLYSNPQGLIVDLSARRLWQSARSDIPGTPLGTPLETLQVRPLDSTVTVACATINVRFALLMPIYNAAGDLWGALVAYHPNVRPISEVELAIGHLVAEQLSLLINRYELQRQQQNSELQQEAAIEAVIRPLHVLPTPDFQQVLDRAIALFQACGGRLYCFEDPAARQTNHRPQADADLQDSQLSPLPQTAAQTAEHLLGASFQLYQAGHQPEKSDFMKYEVLEQYQVWLQHFQGQDEGAWAIHDLYEEAALQPLHPLFQATPIRSLLVLPLWQQQQCIGYLTLFRQAAALPVGSAAPARHYSDRSSQALAPLHRVNSHKPCSKPWSPTEIALGQVLATHITAAIQRTRSQQSSQRQLNDLEAQVQTEKTTLQQMRDRQSSFLRIVTKIRQAIDINQIFCQTTEEVVQLFQRERVAIYQFNPDWSGQFVNDYEFASERWNGLSKLGANTVWADSYLQETRGGRYRYKETFAVDDIYAASHSPCHIEILEQYRIKAYAIAPIFANQQLWGLFAMYQHSSSHHWDAAEVEFLSQVADLLGIAVHQANLATPSPLNLLHASSEPLS